MPKQLPSFEYIKHQVGRTGVIITPHGFVRTPNFIFCATKGSIKGVTPAQLKSAGVEIILSNTYHLMLQPGADLVEQQGGLHKFMCWDGPMLTDSGGFQIFSLGYGSVSDEIKGRRLNSGTQKRCFLGITEEGARFKSYTDGAIHMLTPELSIQIQAKLGVDLIVSFDECTPFHATKEYTGNSTLLSMRWGKRSIDEFTRLSPEGRGLYGIIQGGIYQEFRNISADFVNNNDFFGHAIGGSLGATKSQMEDVVGYTMSLLRDDRPVHLLGIGGISDIFYGVRLGIDTFDCVHPTRIARHGAALVMPHQRTKPGREHINLGNALYRHDSNPVEDGCTCYTCTNFSRSYIHHLIKAGELLSLTLLSIHNIAFMVRLMSRIRAALANNTLDALEQEYTDSALL